MKPRQDLYQDLLGYDLAAFSILLENPLWHDINIASAGFVRELIAANFVWHFAHTGSCRQSFFV
jgi:hypothetical protein